MGKKRRRVPEVLWWLFHHRARTLAETILSLIPPPPATAAGCRCKGRRCLSCSGDDAMSFLLRPNDPPDYRRLLTKSFVVVSENAPPLPILDPQCRWSQLEIVTRTIEMISYEQTSSKNIICWSYDKHNRSSSVVNILTSSAWSHLLRRVGDTLMVYLLKFTSVFLPLPKKKHHQVAGFPINDLCLKVSRHMLDSEIQHRLLDHNALRKKRNEVGVGSMSKKQLSTWALDVEASSNNNKFVGCNGTNSVSNEEFSNEKGKESSNQNITLPGKRKRQFRWQRQRKRRQLAGQGTSSLISCTESSNNNNNFSSGSRGQPGLGIASGLSNGQIVSCFSCCSVFRNLPKIIKKVQVDRKSIFYRLESSSSMFPRKYILHSVKPNDSGAISLFKNIFGTFDVDMNPQSMPGFHGKTCCLSRSTCLCNSLVKLLKTLIRKAKHCQYLRLLDKHCSLPHLDQDAYESGCSLFEGNDSGISFSMKESYEVQCEKKSCHVSDTRSCKLTSEATDYHFEPNKCQCLKKQVVSFIWAVCRSIVPSDLLGMPSNWRILRTNISKFIQLRRFEKFSLNQCMNKLKTSKFPLLSNKSCQLTRDLAKYAEGNCGDMQHKKCCELYATDIIKQSEHEKQEVFYYRKPIWKKLMRESVTCMKGKSYRQLNHASVRQIIRNRSFGFSRARFLPKEHGFRLLANLKASSRMPVNLLSSRVLSNGQLQRKASCVPRNVKYDYFKSVNSVLRDLHVILKGIQTKEQEKLGSSVFDYNDVYRKFVPFLFSLRDGSTTMPSIFIVVSDVSKAFDSVNHDRLLNVIKDVVLDDEYVLEKSIQVSCTKKSLRVRQHLTLADQDIITKSAKIPSCPPVHSLDGVLVKKTSSGRIRKEKVHFILNEHIKRNVLQLDDNFYQQCIGIPQGSVLSSLLCSFYYGHMERNVIFPFLEKSWEPDTTHFSGKHDSHGSSASESNCKIEMIACASKYLLLRFIDDFLFVSTSKKQSAMFFSRLHRGIREYNCYMNEEKYGLNFTVNSLGPLGLRSDRLYVGKDGISFLRWSGLLVNCCTLEIQADYTRYMNYHLSSSLTVCWDGKVGRHLKAKLCDYLRPKCHPIFYDSNINSAAVVRLNIYQAFLLCAMKFHCYVANLSPTFRFSPIFFIDAVDTSLRYMHKLIKKRMHSLIAGCDFRPIFNVKKKETLWLGLYAYVRVLRKKQSRYKELLSLLRSKLMTYWKAENLSPALSYAVDDDHSSLFWNIKY
ncbi:telomerase reverse transcriptase isoform X1 [Olea europaea subsp. europaea]|uniref:Telomerase reverse transcriptase n=1 Tax=Olea europaea subsp. europaea TaxID=158383 RepID=A0A8S0R4L0_OLEEU|nr:telomerase reverse transcriptase isoform X1 [Olea europaea subsp. europaea]